MFNDNMFAEGIFNIIEGIVIPPPTKEQQIVLRECAACVEELRGGG